MIMSVKSFLSPEGSVVSGLATIGIVAGIYQLDVGPVSSVTASDAYSVPATASIKKAGYTALIAVAGITLLARDPNIAILGGAAIFAFHAHYRHANMSHPGTGQIVPPGPQAYQPAQNVVPLAAQASTG
jgi:hypothetical protein